jgi:ABC-type multidrug transport system ATPase subunit
MPPVAPAKSVPESAPVEAAPIETQVAEVPVAEPALASAEVLETVAPEPASAESEPAEPEPAEPEPAEPESAEPEAAEPEPARSGLVVSEQQPELAEPELAEPDLDESDLAEPEAAESDLAEPEAAEPDIRAHTTPDVATAAEAPVAGVETARVGTQFKAPPLTQPIPPTSAPPAKFPIRAPRPAQTAVAPVPAVVETPSDNEHEPSIVLKISALTKRFGSTVAVDGIDLAVKAGSIYGIVGPNGAGKTTTLSMVTGLLRPDSGTVVVHGIDVWRDPVKAKRSIGVLPDNLRLFDRLTGDQLLYYSGTLRGLDGATVRKRAADLVAAFGLEDAASRLVADYSAGMTKKVALAAAMIHSPRLLILDEPFESVDPVSAANLVEILQKYVASGGTVVLSSHGMDFIQRVCDHVAIIVTGKVLASGTMDQVRGKQSLEERFVELAGGRKAAEGMEWLHSFAD